MKILIGTNNQHKAHEIRAILSAHTIVTPKELGLNVDPDETGSSFEENALIKAKAFSAHADLLTLADDSGLEVDCLNGAPGIFSARYVDKPGATDADRRAFLLENLRKSGCPRPWTARFFAAIAMVWPDGQYQIVHGTCEGEIIPEERGNGGFGYDPIFYVPSLGKTLSELSEDEKNAISHRGNALREAKKLID